MYTARLFRTVLIPAAALIESDKNEPTVCRPSELPIYTPDTDTGIKTIHPSAQVDTGVIEEAFAKIRKTVTTAYCELRAYKRVADDYYADAVDNMEWLRDYLQEEENTTPKYGAIAVGGLAGYILGLRGGFFRRTFFAAIGATGMAAVCYPKEAKIYSDQAITESKRLFTIAYNFINGDKESGKVGNEKKIASPDEVKDPLSVVTQVRDEALHSQCHCPIGACLGHIPTSPDDPNT